MDMMTKVRQLTDSIIEAKDPLKTQEDWDLVARLLGRLPVDAPTADAIYRARDAEALDAMITELEHPKPVAPPEPGREVSKEEKSSAMRAFRKRLKLARLADESKLGGHKLSGGRQSNIDAIMPPSQFPRDVWQALASDGRLEDVGQGFYQLKGE